LAVPTALVLAGPTNAPANAADATNQDGDDNKPFSEHKLALQLSDEDPVKHRLVISVAYNMLSIYGPDNITFEVVVFADGMNLLAAQGPSQAEVNSLVSQGVVFSACGNTLDKILRNTGHPFPLNPKARRVNAGVARLLTLGEKGFTIIRP
jgi:intracellular sulfur oxidation DsrE/DsrF family protein